MGKSNLTPVSKLTEQGKNAAAGCSMDCCYEVTGGRGRRLELEVARPVCPQGGRRRCGRGCRRRLCGFRFLRHFVRKKEGKARVVQPALGVPTVKRGLAGERKEKKSTGEGLRRNGKRVGRPNVK
ncbi:unnamed protein product [Citrullus colocynthis]|uniref:Uncharacterized protein n=1 Tax=Citrullus colocynthis TaxID=252529 RepID=A0ABP0XP61_9ROSI